MLIGLAKEKINELITGRKIGITYDVDNEAFGKARGGIFAEHLQIKESILNRQGNLSTISIERGSRLTDNFKVGPASVQLAIFVNDNDELFDNSIITTAKNLITGTTNLSEAAKLLDYLYLSDTLCDIKTLLYDYNGYKLVQINAVENSKTHQFIGYNTTWQEVPFYDDEYYDLRKRITGEDATIPARISKLLNF